MAAYVVYPSKEQENDVLPEHVLEGIRKGQEDVEVGNTITFEEFKERLLSAN